MLCLGERKASGRGVCISAPHPGSRAPLPSLPSRSRVAVPSPQQQGPGAQPAISPRQAPPGPTGATRAKRRREGGGAERAPGPRLGRGQLGGRSAGRQPWPQPGPAAPRSACQRLSGPRCLPAGRLRKALTPAATPPRGASPPRAHITRLGGPRPPCLPARARSRPAAPASRPAPACAPEGVTRRSRGRLGHRFLGLRRHQVGSAGTWREGLGRGWAPPAGPELRAAGVRARGSEAGSR